MAANVEDYVHPAHCGVQSCHKVIQLMRAQHFLNAVQRAGEHRRVLGGRYFVFFKFFQVLIYKSSFYEIN